MWLFCECHACRNEKKVSEFLKFDSFLQFRTCPQKVLFRVLLVESRVSCSPSWTPTHCAAKDGLKFLIVQTSLPKFHSGRHVIRLLQSAFLFVCVVCFVLFESYSVHSWAL